MLVGGQKKWVLFVSFVLLLDLPAPGYPEEEESGPEETQLDTATMAKAAATVRTEEHAGQIQFETRKKHKYTIDHIPPNADRAEYEALSVEDRSRFLTKRESILKGFIAILDAGTPYLGLGSTVAERLVSDDENLPAEEKTRIRQSLVILKNAFEMLDQIGLPENPHLTQAERRDRYEVAGQNVIRSMVKGMDEALWSHAGDISRAPDFAKMDEWAGTCEGGVCGGAMLGRKGLMPAVSAGFSVTVNRKRRQITFGAFLDWQQMRSVVPGYIGAGAFVTAMGGRRYSRWEQALGVKDGLVLGVPVGVLFVSPDEILFGSGYEAGLGFPPYAIFEGRLKRIPLFRVGIAAQRPFLQAQTIAGPALKALGRTLVGWCGDVLGLIGRRTPPNSDVRWLGF